MSDEWTFKRALVVEHNARKKKSGTYVSKKMITLKLFFFASPAVEKNSDRNCTFHNFCRARWDWDNLTGIFPCHKLHDVFTEVSEWTHVLLNITLRSMYAQGLEYRYWRQSVQFFPIQTDLGWWKTFFLIYWFFLLFKLNEMFSRRTIMI